ncbi:hypothetical protein EWM64_g2446 [Hericium alpestre]|uniref:Peptidase A1 domain-containing protein n=1 Tax=Hericium alpestre TaxID=135208 RepID=A0A4Z0A3H3_9AGAM|nr:hypothetical protein EWM64_g2446 [Hericium alpestre]
MLRPFITRRTILSANMRVFLALSALAGLASAIRLPPQIRSAGRPHVVEFRVKRDGRKASHNPAVFNGSIINQGDQSYLTSAHIGSGTHNVTLVLDTGSSDLWVSDSRKLTVNNISRDEGVNLTYGLGSAIGNIAYAPVSVGTYRIPSQALVIANDTEQLDVEGILGLGFDSASQIYNTTGNASEAVTPLSNLFAQNASATNSSNFIALDLSRGPDGETTIGGAFTISQYLSDYGSVADQPQLPVTPANSTNWSVAVDGVNVNGQSYNISQDAPEGSNATAVIDSGTSLALVSSNLSDFIYQNISGARSCQSDQGQVWVVPCLNASNVTFQFGGQQYPINPLDLTTVQTYSVNQSTTVAVCLGVFTGVGNVSPTLADIPFYILGDSFMRNVYTSFNFGNNTLAGNFSSSDTGPSVQFLSKSNDTNATYSEFLTQRQQTLSKMDASPIDPSSADCSSVQSLLSKA